MDYTVQGVLVEVSGAHRTRIDRQMKRFGSASRYAYVRLCNRAKKLDLEKDVSKTFRLNGRWGKDVVAFASANLVSAKEHVKEGRLEDVRKIIWGGRENWEKLNQGELTNAEWKDLRSRQLYARGEASKSGNLNLRIVEVNEDDGTEQENILRLRISLGPWKWIFPKLWIPPKFRDRIKELLESGRSYTIRVLRRADRRYNVNVTFDVSVPEIVGFENGAIGIDLNPGGQAWAETNEKGQLIDHGWIPTHILMFASRTKRDQVIQGFAHRIAELALAKGKGAVLEDLKFKRSKGSRYGHKLNRIFNNFVYAKLGEAIERRCLERGVPVRKINPAFTSVTGELKYREVYKDLTVHEAAALVIARRGQGFQDMPTGDLRTLAWKTLEGRTRKKFHPWSWWRALKPKNRKAKRKRNRKAKRSAHCGRGKTSGTTRERKQGIQFPEPEMIPPVKSTPQCGNVGPGNPAPLMG